MSNLESQFYRYLSFLSMHASKTAVLIAAIIGIIATFLPWEKVSLPGVTEIIPGTKVAGWVSCGLCSIAALVGCSGTKSAVNSTQKKWIVVTMGLLTLPIGIYEYIVVSGEPGGNHPGLTGLDIQISAGIGTYLVIFAGLALIIIPFVFKAHSLPANSNGPGSMD